ncbi:type II secretion system protein GspK [Stenotrophomonas sp. Marseille-Q4652]|uniref:general secretion pathway protein GspK n=1 Tax=Stenotrophomonas sp. Marseille-Q4652 TaxID=2866595 RepID=UPI001CE41514|nr:type II secretion system protein GspK [Stenotrophomonas sp. Marseille-Q4652]
MRMRGAALVLVLWLVALLTALVGAFALTARVEHLQGRVLAETAAGQERARAGIEYALVRLQGSPDQPAWLADGRRYRWQFDQARIDLRIIDESGKIDINNADPALLAALFQALEVEPNRAQQLAGAIIDWRDSDDLRQPVGGAEDPDYATAGLPYGAKDARFDSVGELQRVLGMDAGLMARLVPLVTVYGDRSRPDPRFAPGPVLAAMGLDAAAVLAAREAGDAAAVMDPEAPPSAPGSGTYSIEARAQLDEERETVVRAVVRSGPSAVPGMAYTVLRWEHGTGTR